MIAKPGGGERALGIPTILDRLAQTAAKLILEPIWEADLEPNAYGYRPRNGAQDAMQKVDELLHAGYTDIVDADLFEWVLPPLVICPFRANAVHLMMFRWGRCRLISPANAPRRRQTTNCDGLPHQSEQHCL